MRIATPPLQTAGIAEQTPGWIASIEFIYYRIEMLDAILQQLYVLVAENNIRTPRRTEKDVQSGIGVELVDLCIVEVKKPGKMAQ